MLGIARLLATSYLLASAQGRQQDRFEKNRALNTVSTDPVSAPYMLLPSDTHYVIEELPSIEERKEALNIIKVNSQLLEFQSVRVKDNREIVSLAVKKAGYPLVYASDRLKDDREIVKLAIQKYPRALKHASSRLKDDKELVTLAIKNGDYSILSYASEGLRDDLEVCKLAVETHYGVLLYASERLKDNKELVTIAVQKKGMALKDASKRLKDDTDLVKIAVLSTEGSLQFASERLKDNKELVTIAVQKKGMALKYASKRLKDDTDLVKIAVLSAAGSLQFASNRLKDDKAFIRLLVQKHGYVLKYASARLKDDKDIVKISVQEDGQFIVFASDRLRGDKEIVKIAVQADGMYLKHASKELKGDKEIVRVAIHNRGSALEYASTRLKDDEVLVFEATKKSHYAMQYVSLRFREDKDIVLRLISKNGYALQFLYKFKDDEDVVLAAVQKNGGALEYAGSRLKNDFKIVLAAIVESPDSLQFASERLKGFLGLLMKHLEPNDFRDYITDDFKLDYGKICQDVNSGYNPSKEIPLYVGLLRLMLRIIPTQDFSSAFVSNFLTHTPFVFRDDTLSRDDVSLSSLFPFDLTVVDTDPSKFTPQFIQDLQAKNIQTMTQASLYNTHSAAPEKTENTQDTLYYSKTPVLLLINSDQLHSGHNDLLQDRRWLGKKISKHVKILIVGAYSELTSDVQNRVEATYLDEYSVKSENKVSKKKESKPYQSEYKKLARLTSEAALESDIMNLEMRLQGTFTQDSLLVLQNSYEYSSLSSEVTEKDTTCRYLPTRIIDSSFTTRPESEADIFIYQYVSSFDKQVEHALNHADIFLDDTDAISSFLEDTVLRIPVKPKLDIVSKVRKEADQWQLQFANHWYPIQDVQIRLASPSITPQSPSVKCDTELLRDLYYDKSPLYMRNAISRTIFDVLSDFVKHDKQWLIFEGVPALGKDAYTKQFLMSLKQSSLQLYTQEISSSPDQSLLEQVMDIYEAHKHVEIMLQVSEINLISPAQLDEVVHFIHEKNIKIIGTQNAQTQIRNRFKIDKNVFNIITLELKDTDKESYFSDLFDWVANHYNIPLKSATEALNNLYLHNKVKDPNNPVTPRQLLYFAKKMKQTIVENGLEYATEHSSKIFNSIFFQHLEYIVAIPFRVVDSEIETKAVTQIEQQPVNKRVSETFYRLLPNETTPVNVWHGAMQLFLDQNEPYDIAMGPHNDSMPDAYRLVTAIEPGKELKIPSLVGSIKGIISYTTGPEYGNFNRDTKIFSNSAEHKNKINITVTYENPISLFSEIRGTSVSNSIDIATLYETINTNSLNRQESFILRHFIFDKMGSESYTKKDLLMALGLAHKDSYSEKDILGCVYDYFAKFREESIPPALATGLDLYDSLVFQKGVCRHQAELGRLIFSALDIPVEKKMSNNPEGESFHDYLVVDMNEKKIVMDFRYTSQRVIQKQEREFRPKDIQKKEHVKRQDQSKDFSGLDVQPNKTDSEELLQDGQTLDGLPMDFLLILSCSTILSVLYLAYLYQKVFRRQDHFQGPSQSHPQRQVDYRVPWRTLTGLGLGTLITGYAVQSSWNSHSIEHKRGPTLRRHDSKVPTLKEVLRGSAQDWKQNGEEIALGLLEEVPSVGSESETRFVSADTELSSFGTPVYNGKELIGYRIQYEVAAEGYFSGIVLEPNDVPSEKQEETLLLTREGLVKYEDYNPVSNNLIEGRGEERQRALTLTKFLSERLGIAFQYESELKPGNLRGAKAKTFGEL